MKLPSIADEVCSACGIEIVHAILEEKLVCEERGGKAHDFKNPQKQASQNKLNIELS